MEDSDSRFEDRVIIIGVGLIGGSIAAAIRQRFAKCEVVGVGRSAARLAMAQKSGLLTSWTTEISADLLKQPCVVVVCLPVNLIAAEVCRVAALASDGVLITDAGSIKALICQDIGRDAVASRLFVGAHPIAGGEQGGFEHADAELFAGRICVVIDSEDADRNTRVKQFWAAIGCEIMAMTAAEHDQRLALTSHLPHVMAAVTTAATGLEYLSLTGSGFRDATRIAAGDAALWKEILTGNRRDVVVAIRRAEQLLAEYRRALETDDDDEVESLLRTAAEWRARLDSGVESRDVR